MSQPSPPRKTRKLLVVSFGVGVLALASCASSPGCEIMFPPPICSDPSDEVCRDQGTPDFAHGPHDLADHD
jgi:hypothetical protein